MGGREAEAELTEAFLAYHKPIERAALAADVVVVVVMVAEANPLPAPPLSHSHSHR